MTQAAAALPQKIGKYDVKRILATGTMGDLYQASTLDERTRTPIYFAIKVLNPKIARKLPFVSRIKSDVKEDCVLEFKEVDYDAKVQDFFVADYLEVKPVSRGILRRERSPEILGLFARLAQALDKAHRKGYVHGNVKTSNVLIRRARDEKGVDTAYPLLSDFGLTYAYDPAYFVGPRFRAVFPYMSPERIEKLVAGDVKNEGLSPAADVYSLAAVLAEALSGAAPYADGSDVDGLLKAKRERKYLLLHVNHPVRRVDIKKLNETLRRALAPDPGGRFATAADFASELLACRLEPAKA
jgi:serine/threonine-protein kinase